jgi:hypothetical protein
LSHLRICATDLVEAEITGSFDVIDTQVVMDFASVRGAENQTR